MLNDLLYLNWLTHGDVSPLPFPQSISANATHVLHFRSLVQLIEYLSVSINYTLVRFSDGVQRIPLNTHEKEIDYATIIVVNTNEDIWKEEISIDTAVKLLKYRFSHLNIIILPVDPEDKIREMREYFPTRLQRMKLWTGFSNAELLDTMDGYVDSKAIKEEDLKLFTDLLSRIQYDKLLFHVNADREKLWEALNKWDFDAFQFNLDELLVISFLIFERFIKPENSNNLKSFLFFVRDNYHIGNPFHNFRHAVDVLQATNMFLNSLIKNSNYKISKLDSFSLLLASLGHDIGHPGITNAFLISNKSPLAVKFNNISILENFHRFQFQRILIPFLNQSMENNLLSIEMEIDVPYLLDIVNYSILATDMAKHDEFVGEIERLITEFDNFKLLACFLIKCADISNVCRTLNTSCKWGLSLGEEFKQIALLEKYLKNEIKPSDEIVEFDFKKPIKNIDAKEGIVLVPKLAGNQMFFINRFATDFFTKISDSLPPLYILSSTLRTNTTYWEQSLKN